MSTNESRLKKLGLVLPSDVRPAGQYTPAVRYGKLIYVSGQLPRRNGDVVFKGSVGMELTADQARVAAEIAALRFLAAASEVAGSLEALAQVLELKVYVRSAPNFSEQTYVADAASRLLTNVLGGSLHARTAVGVAELPQGAAVEVAGVAVMA